MEITGSGETLRKIPGIPPVSEAMLDEMVLSGVTVVNGEVTKVTLKRGPGRPATGVISVSRSVSLPQEYWTWVEGLINEELPTRSHVIKSLLDQVRAKK